MKKKAALSITSIIALNVVCLSFATFAWFTAQNTVDNGVNDIVAVDGSLVSGIQIFNIDRSENHEPGYRYFSDVADDNEEFILAEYSPLEKRCQSLIKVTLSGRYSSISVSALIDSDDPYYVGNRSDTNPDHALKASGNPLSSIVCFEVFKDDDESIVVHDAENHRYCMLYQEDKIRDSFVDEEYTSVSTELDLGELTDVYEFYILVSYNEESIDNIYSKYLGDPIISGETYKSLLFEIDFRFHLKDNSGENNA